MTRKDYRLLAGVLAEVKRPDCTPEAWQMRVLLTHALTEALAADNPRFDPKKFLAAAGCCNPPE